MRSDVIVIVRSVFVRVLDRTRRNYALYGILMPPEATISSTVTNAPGHPSCLHLARGSDRSGSGRAGDSCRNVHYYIIRTNTHIILTSNSRIVAWLIPLSAYSSCLPISPLPSQHTHTHTHARARGTCCGGKWWRYAVISLISNSASNRSHLFVIGTVIARGRDCVAMPNSVSKLLLLLRRRRRRRRRRRLHAYGFEFQFVFSVRI